MAELSLRTFDHRDLSEYHSNNLKFHASFCHLTWSECPRASVCLFICKTKLKTLTEWTVSGPEGGIAITPNANTEYHPLLEGGAAAGCGIDTKVVLRKISDKIPFSNRLMKLYL
jgi:hypothetical protein